MSVLRKGLVVTTAFFASLCNVQAQESAELVALHRIVIHGCPNRWEEIQGYINHDVDHLESRIIYTEDDHENRLDVWAGDIRDRHSYIKFALSYFMDDEGNVLENYTHIASVLYGCGVSRHEYFSTLSNERYLETASFASDGRFNEFKDDDNDGVMNSFDQCLTTTNQGITEGTGVYYIDERYLTQLIDGCAAWERYTTDNDGVADHFDYCEGTPDGVAVVADGCKDTDSDGSSDRLDPYPFQNDFQCMDSGS